MGPFDPLILGDDLWRLQVAPGMGQARLLAHELLDDADAFIEVQVLSLRAWDILKGPSTPLGPPERLE